MLVGFVLALSACASKYRPLHIYYLVEVENNSSEALSDVTVTLTGIDRRIDCGDIAPLRICYQGIGKRRYDYYPIRIDWTSASGTSESREFVIDVPATYATGIPLRAVIDISAEGEMTAYFEQDTVI